MTARFTEPSPANVRLARKIFRAMEKPGNYASQHGEKITAAYAGRWVAITAKGVIASSKSQAGLKRRLAGQNFKPGELYNTYIFPVDQVLIL